MGSPWEAAEASNQTPNLADSGSIAVTISIVSDKVFKGFSFSKSIRDKIKIIQSLEKRIGHIPNFDPRSFSF